MHGWFEMKEAASARRPQTTFANILPQGAELIIDTALYDINVLLKVCRSRTVSRINRRDRVGPKINVVVLDKCRPIWRKAVF